MTDFLGGNPFDDFLVDDTAEQKQERLDNAVEFAQLYLVFETDERAKRLLEHWRETILLKDTPVESSLQRYAADQSQRQLVIGIEKQIKLAKEGFPK